MCPTCPKCGAAHRSPAGDYVVELRADGTTIRPTRSLILGHSLVMFFLGVYCLALIVGALSGGGNGLVGLVALIVLIPFGLLGAIVHAWLGRGDALVVEASGRVTYARTELASANAVVLVILAKRKNLDAKMFDLSLLGKDGSTIRLPGPYFADLTDANAAAWLALQLARLLRVPVEMRSATGPVTHDVHPEKCVDA